MPAVVLYTISDGVQGTIKVVHFLSGGAKVVADLDVSVVNLTTLQSLDPDCQSVSGYKWYIHTK
ncbi:hypothetical protein H257_03051 [Aphanomyces astaci]|uniref:Uncharacterized protein n=1 Tax=Aphanomyces astaci TaxID=112090 RepID=W4H240_APHAT|nr:hypothetical protein H257_03051 [Aphanomyces astaci]ETV85238.1 hypothetical protein H257_03051 [Aphanomyces astaci]|eukprot:XP_009825256.1 hypothetical protein H257_03051 [Aphanomyces astaci]